MTLATWDVLRPDIAPDVGACPYEKIDDAVKRVVIDFCRRTSCYRIRAILPDAGGAGMRALPVALVPAGTRLVQLLKPSFDGEPIEPVGEDVVSGLYGNWRTLVATPLYLVRERSDTGFWLVPGPTATTTTSLVVTSVLTPSEDATGVDDSVLNEFRDQVINGVKGRLLAMNEPWSNPTLATFHLGLYENQVSVIRNRSDRGADRQRRVVKAYPF